MNIKYICYLKIFIFTFLIFRALGEPSKKKTTKVWTSSKHGWGVSDAAKPLIEKKFGHVFRVKGPRPK